MPERNNEISKGANPGRPELHWPGEMEAYADRLLHRDTGRSAPGGRHKYAGLMLRTRRTARRNLIGRWPDLGRAIG